MSKYNNAVNSDAYSRINNLIGSKNTIVDLYVRGKWLVAVLASGCKFMVLNK